MKFKFDFKKSSFAFGATFNTEFVSYGGIDASSLKQKWIDLEFIREN